MAESKCPRCDSRHFEVVHANNLQGTNRTILFVQCANCGSVVGVLDFINIGLQVNDLKNDFDRAVERLRMRFN